MEYFRKSIEKRGSVTMPTRIICDKVINPLNMNRNSDLHNSSTNGIRFEFEKIQDASRFIIVMSVFMWTAPFTLHFPFSVAQQTNTVSR